MTNKEAYDKGCKDMIEIINRQMAMIPNPFAPFLMVLHMVDTPDKFDGYDPPKEEDGEKITFEAIDPLNDKE